MLWQHRIRSSRVTSTRGGVIIIFIKKQTDSVDSAVFSSHLNINNVGISPAISGLYIDFQI